jgi:hypothetical protein
MNYYKIIPTDVFISVINCFIIFLESFLSPLPYPTCIVLTQDKENNSGKKKIPRRETRFKSQDQGTGNFCAKLKRSEFFSTGNKNKMLSTKD